jgi:hypothetical protein
LKRVPKEAILQGLGVSICTQTDTIPVLKEAVTDAVQCHFDDGKRKIVVYLQL